MADTKPEAMVAPTSPQNDTGNLHANSKHQSSFPAPPVYPAFRMPAHLPQPPFIDVEGIPNFREVGGYLCRPKRISTSDSDKYIVRRALIYRCAHPTQITPKGKMTFSEGLSIKAIYDLRSAPEVTRTNAAVAAAMDQATSTPDSPKATVISPSFEIPGATRQFTPVFVGEDYSPDGLSRRLRWYSTGTTSEIPRANQIGAYSPGFLNAYRDIANHGVPAYTTIFKHILNSPNDPLMFHCTAGKDRTGVIAALILRLAGVDDETICWEYALTEPGLGPWREIFIKRMTDHGINAGSQPNSTATNVDGRSVELLSRAEATNICSSRAGNMRAFLKLVLDEEFGGIEAYLEQKCAFSQEDIEKIRRNLVVKVDTVGPGNIVTPVEIKGWTPNGGIEDESAFAS